MNAYRKESESFFKKEYIKLKSYIKNRFRDLEDEDAEDVLQDVALHFFNKVDFDSPVQNLAAYIFRSVRNKIIDLYRKQKDIVSISNYENDEETENFLLKITSDYSITDADIENNEFLGAYEAALGLLKKEQKDIWIATEIEGRSFEDLSKEWGVPIGTLLARKHRAKARLQQILIEFK